jgi:ABC-2 type transport system ATP-binding protein
VSVDPGRPQAQSILVAKPSRIVDDPLEAEAPPRTPRGRAGEAPGQLDPARQRGVAFGAERGRIFSLLGPNGSGKTTTIGILTGLVAPDAGSVRVSGVDVVAHPGEVRARIALTGQSAAVDELLTGEENLRLMARLWGLGPSVARRRSAELLEQFGLVDAGGRPVRSYSGGMRRRLDLALSLVRTPEVLFLDEPTTGLDPGSRRALWDIIRSLAAAGTTVFLTTQYLEEADQLADHIAVLHAGAVVAEGTARQLKSRLGGDVVEVTDAQGVVLRRVPTDGTLPGVRAAIDSLVAEGVAGQVSIHRPTLDEVFLALTADPRAEQGALR